MGLTLYGLSISLSDAIVTVTRNKMNSGGLTLKRTPKMTDLMTAPLATLAQIQVLPCSTLTTSPL